MIKLSFKKSSIRQEFLNSKLGTGVNQWEATFFKGGGLALILSFCGGGRVEINFCLMRSGV